MSEPHEPNAPTDGPAAPPTVAHLEFKAALLLVFMLLLVCGSALYLLYARGAFEATQTVVLVSDDSEGVVVGMDLTFSGFPIGRVRRIELAEDGTARIIIDVPRKDAHWLRESSVFTLVRGLVGTTNIRAFSGMLKDPPLPDGAVRQVLRGDASAEVPRVLAAVKDLVDNLNAVTAKEGPLGATLANLQATTEKLNGPGGALGVLLGNEKDAQKLLVALDRANTLLARLDSVAAKVDTLAAKTDAQVFGQEGVMQETRATIVQLNTLLADARSSLKKVDAVLQEAQAIGANAREATTDLGALRADVEANLRKIESLVTEINRKWPFARDTELKLP
ncbi:MAG TPA: MlaD family protein [Burkholderiaceae bacterium]|nr:MlaD family protein [Burkholderiaceae bacterium]